MMSWSHTHAVHGQWLVVVREVSAVNERVVREEGVVIGLGTILGWDPKYVSALISMTRPLFNCICRQVGR